MAYVISLILLFAGYSTANQHTGLIITDSFNSNNKPISPGPQDYENLLQDSEVLIDKSLLIKEIIDDSGKVFLITCPRRWGKSVNLNLMKTFFEIQVSDGNPISPISSTSSYRFFVNGEIGEGSKTKKLKTPLLIAKHKDIVDKYLGQYPVIHLKNLGNVFLDNTVQKTDESISHVFHEHFYLQSKLEKTISDGHNDSVRVEAQQRLEKFDKYVSATNMSESEFTESLNFLSELLHWCFNKKVFVLIDEYQSPWEEAVIPNTTPNLGAYHKKFFQIYTSFMEKTFTKNKYLQKGILTGVPFVLQDLRRTAFKEIIECSLLTGKFMEYYGFNQYEMKTLSQLLNVSSDKQEEMHRWYGGYKVNSTKLQIYNPWSVVNYLIDYKLDTYWIKTWAVTFEFFLEIDSFRDRFHSLVDGNNIIVKFSRQRFLWVEFEKLFHARIGNSKLKANDDQMADMAFMYLYMSGYLTLSEDFHPDLKYYKMRLPNQELREAMKQQLYRFYNHQMNFDDSSRELVSGELLKCMHNAEVACTALKDTIEGHLPLRILMQEDDGERILHMMLCWLLTDTPCLQKDFHSPSIREGKPQVLLVFENRTVIMRAKYAAPAAYIALREARSWTNKTHEIRHPVEQIKFIGMNLNDQKFVDVNAEIVKYYA